MGNYACNRNQQNTQKGLPLKQAVPHFLFYSIDKSINKTRQAILPAAFAYDKFDIVTFCDLARSAQAVAVHDLAQVFQRGGGHFAQRQAARADREARQAHGGLDRNRVDF